MMSAPTSCTWSMYMALTVPPVPTGMKAGVRISPRGMLIAPRRALPSVASTLKEKASAIEFLVVHRRAWSLFVERLPITDAAAHEFFPGRHGDRRLGLFRQQIPQIGMVP